VLPDVENNHRLADRAFASGLREGVLAVSATLIVIIPIALLGIVALLGFTGCGLPVTGLPPDFTTYSTDTVLSNVNCVAYWPLNDPAGSTMANEIKGMPANTGSYLNPTTAPALYPWNSANFGDPSAAAGSTPFQLQQPGIVIGDEVPNTTNNQPCMVVNGALVLVPQASAINPAEFTVEAWVSVNWGPNDEPAERAVLNCHDINPVATGFAILAAVDTGTNPPTYRWNAEVGNGTAAGFAILGTASDPIVLNDPSTEQGPAVYHLALTFDGTILNFFINGTSVEKTNTAYAPNTTQPLYIGAGAPFAGLRTKPPTPNVVGPLFPYNGAIQDVAIYSKPLGDADIALHHANGLGKKTA